jgi:hypothetical protein
MPLTSARDLLPADPQGALALLRNTAGPAADWLRAVAAAHLGDPLRAQVALRRVSELPEEALADVALPFAQAALAEDRSLAAWLPLAAAVHAAVGEAEPVSPAHLAWELLVRATDATEDDTPARAVRVLTLGALARLLHKPAESAQLLRTAQELARRNRQPELFVAATRALQLRAEEDGDAELAAELQAWGARMLRADGFADAAAQLEGAGRSAIG